MPVGTGGGWLPGLAGLTSAQDLVRRVAADPGGELTTAVLAPGGCGKTAVLAAARAAYLAAATTVVAADALPLASPDEAAVLVDDAHQLPADVLSLLVDLVGKPGARLLVAMRPWPRPPALIELAAALRRTGPLLVLQHLDRAGVEQRAAAVLGGTPPADLVDLLARSTAGQPRLLDQALATVQAGSLAGVTEPRRLLPQLVEQVSPLVDALAEAPRALLHAVALGAGLETQVLSALLGMPAEEVHEVVDEARATGFLLADGRCIPLVAQAVLAATPAERTRDAQAALLEVRHAHGADVVPLARALARSGVRRPLVAHVLEDAGDETLVRDPARALDLYDDAVAAGAGAASLAARRAEAAALAGDLDRALQLADSALADPASPDPARAVEVAATVMSFRGLLGRGVDLYRWLGPERVGPAAPLAALALLGVGAPDEAAAMTRVRSDGVPTLLGGAKSLMAQGVAQSVAGSVTAALSTLSRGATLLEPAARGALLPDTPPALLALVALQVGELDIAESGLRRAVDVDLGGVLARARHRLLLAWAAMLRGRYPQARELVAAAGHTPADGRALEPRDELFARALEVGLARHAGDVPGMVAAWPAAREALVRHPVDLFVLLPLGELTVAAARLRCSHLVAPYLDDAWALLARLGDPVAWSAGLHWASISAAILEERPESLEPHASALAECARNSAYAGALAAAADVWLHALHGRVDPERAHAAGRGLQRVGLAWDGSRLLGQVAARSEDRKAMTSLLQAARLMQEPEDAGTDSPGEPGPGEPAPESPRPAAVLSSRELEVAELLLDNHTYREIGARLYLSPKTVEHHVARMKQRLGVSGRSELLTELRVLAGSTRVEA